MSDEVRMLWVGNGQVGIVGLDEVLEKARENGLAGEGLEIYLLQNVKEKNYVPTNSERDYVEALVREYRRFCGEGVEDRPAGILCVEVLGPGCPECDHLEEEVRNVLSELGIGGNVEHIRDPERIKKYKVFGGPGLVINGQLRAAGKAPSRKELIDWFKEEGT